MKYARHQGFLKIVSLGVVAPWMALCGVLACLPRCDNEFSQPIPVIEASVPNELCQPKEGMGAPQYPVGTRGGVGWMWGPCACPPRGSVSWQGLHRPSPHPGASRTSTRPPPLPASTPCPYRSEGTLPHSVGKIHHHAFTTAGATFE